MHDMLAEPITAERPAEAADGRLVRLSQARPGDRGVIVEVRAETHPGDHGAELEVLHEGAIRRDPIAVRLDSMRVALRRRDAEDVWLLLAAQ
jgi:ferrous iron transport protein A